MSKASALTLIKFEIPRKCCIVEYYQQIVDNIRQTNLMIVISSNISNQITLVLEESSFLDAQRRRGAVHQLIYISRDSNPGSSVGNAR